VITLLPQAAALIGYALFLDDLDHYYYLPLMPAAVLTVVLALTAPVPRRRAAWVLGAALLVAALAITPSRLRLAATLHPMPEYRVLVNAARKVAALRQPMRAIRAEFTLPPSAEPEFMFRILGGRIERTSPWYSIITADGSVIFRKVKEP
jgi:hypothetical protein